MLDWGAATPVQFRAAPLPVRSKAIPGLLLEFLEQQVTLIQTAIKGRKPDASKLHLADFTIAQDAAGVPLAITCPEGQTVPVNARGQTPALCGRLCQRHL